MITQWNHLITSTFLLQWDLLTTCPVSMPEGGSDEEEEIGRRGGQKSLNPLSAQWSRVGGGVKQTLTCRRRFAGRNKLTRKKKINSLFTKSINIHKAHISFFTFEGQLQHRCTEACIYFSNAQVTDSAALKKKILKISEPDMEDAHMRTHTVERLWWSWGRSRAGCLRESTEGEQR